MEHQTSITDKKWGLERAHKTTKNGFNFWQNFKGVLYQLLSYKSCDMDVILKLCFYFFRPSLWSPVGLSSYV